MTLCRTHKVLDDCRLALEMLESETDTHKWRVIWVGAMALIRAVGHVMERECKDDPALADKCKFLYSKWRRNSPEDEIFLRFIKRERDFILKEYEFNIDTNDVVQIAVTPSNLEDHNSEQDLVFPLDENIYRPLVDSYRESDDARDVYAEAIEWWEKQIEIFEKL